MNEAPTTFEQATNDEPQAAQPQWANLQGVLGCVMAAAQDAFPVFAESFFNCLNGSGPPTSGYAPGDRKRCG